MNRRILLQVKKMISAAAAVAMMMSATAVTAWADQVKGDIVAEGTVSKTSDTTTLADYTRYNVTWSTQYIYRYATASETLMDYSNDIYIDIYSTTTGVYRITGTVTGTLWSVGKQTSSYTTQSVTYNVDTYVYATPQGVTSQIYHYTANGVVGPASGTLSNVVNPYIISDVSSSLTVTLVTEIDTGSGGGMSQADIDALIDAMTDAADEVTTSVDELKRWQIPAELWGVYMAITGDYTATWVDIGGAGITTPAITLDSNRIYSRRTVPAGETRYYYTLSTGSAGQVNGTGITTTIDSETIGAWKLYKYTVTADDQDRTAAIYDRSTAQIVPLYWGSDESGNSIVQAVSSIQTASGAQNEQLAEDVQTTTQAAITAETQIMEQQTQALDTIDPAQAVSNPAEAMINAMDWIRQVHAATIEQTPITWYIGAIMIMGLGVYIIGRRG